MRGEGKAVLGISRQDKRVLHTLLGVPFGEKGEKNLTFFQIERQGEAESGNFVFFEERRRKRQPDRFIGGKGFIEVRASVFHPADRSAVLIILTAKTVQRDVAGGLDENRKAGVLPRRRIAVFF